MPQGVVFAVFVSLFLCFAEARAAAVRQLLEQPLRNAAGEPVGTLDDLIIDVDAGRVLYLVIDRGDDGYATVPVRALLGDRLVDMSEAGEIARQNAQTDARFRRASNLLGDTVMHPHPGDPTRVGTIRDIEFESRTGRVERVVLMTDEGEFGVGAGVLEHRVYPPLGRRDHDYADKEALGERGWLRREPSDARQRLHEHEWR